MVHQSIEIPKNNTDLSFILRKRLERIELEMDDFNRVMREFALAADREIHNFVHNMPKLQKNLNQVLIYRNSSTKPEQATKKKPDNQTKP